MKGLIKRVVLRWGSETQTEDEAIGELGVGENESNRLLSAVYRVLKSFTDKCSRFGSSLGVAFKTISFSPGCERPTASLLSLNPPPNELSIPPGNNFSGIGSVPPNQEDVGVPHPGAGMEFQDNTGPLGPGSPAVSTSPSNPSVVRVLVRRIRIKVSPQDPLDSSNSPMNYYVDLEMGGDNGYRLSRVVPPMKLGKTFLGLTYQAMSSFLIYHYQASGNTSRDHSPQPSHLLLQIVEINLMVGFTATLIAVLLHQAHPEKSVIIEGVGSMSAAFGFFLMMSMLLKSIPEWIGWTCALGALLAFVIAFLKRKND